jgi:multiple sugar transport system permease protein
LTVPILEPGGRALSAAAGSARADALRRSHRGIADFLFVTPTWVFMIAVGLIPAVYALWMSLTSSALIGGTGEFVGLQNYIRAVFTPRFLGSLGVTMLFVVLGLVIQFVVGYLLAVALHRQLRGFRIARTVLLIPMLLTPVVVGLMWNFMFNPDLGIIGAFVRLFGPGINFFADPLLAIGVIVLLDSWMFIPFVMLMMVAGMTGVPDEVREASALDGASWWQATRYVILPILKPVITVTLIVRCVDIVRLFDTIYTTTKGGPGTSTSTVSLLSYATTFQFYEFGQGAAMSIALTLVMFPVYFLYIRMTRV